MLNKIFFYFVIFDALKFAISNNISNPVTIKEVCVPAQIAELERYLEEHDIPEVPISNTATYIRPAGVEDHFDSPAAARTSPRLSADGEIELSPFGALPVDWKRLQLLHDLLNRPQDRELKSKLLGLLKILLAAYQRVRKHLDHQPKSKNEEAGVVSTPRSVEDSKTTRHRFERSTTSEEKDEDSQEFSGFSSATETALNFGSGFSEAPDFGDENLRPEFQNGVPQLEEIEKKLKDDDFGKQGSREIGFENPGHPDSRVTVNEIGSRVDLEEAGATTEEIKPDGKSWDLETISSPFSARFTSTPSLLTIDEKTTPTFPPRDSLSAVLQAEDYSGKKIERVKIFGKGPERKNDFLESNEREEKSEGGIFESAAKGGESFPDIPERVKLVFIKNGDEKEERSRHVSRVHNFNEGRSDGGGGGSWRIDSSQEYSFYDKKRRPGKESPLIFYRDKLQKGIFQPSDIAVSKNGRHRKRAGENTDLEKLYRWFYRAGDVPGKSNAGRAEIKCRNY